MSYFLPSDREVIHVRKRCDSITDPARHLMLRCMREVVPDVPVDVEYNG